jgi:RNA-directed DNA polymerase
MKNINSWHDIEWDIIEDQVFQLQLRIFRAAENRELNKVHKLQTCLISSYFARYLSIRKVVFDNIGKKVSKIDMLTLFSPVERFVLSNHLLFDKTNSIVQQFYKFYPDGKQRVFLLSTIEDRAKQMLAYLALSPQWEAQFELVNYKLRLTSNRVIFDPMEAIFFGVSKKSGWVLKANISKYFQQTNYPDLIEKCQTFPEMQKQIDVWLQTGVLNIKKYISPSLNISQKGIISTLLLNILIHDFQKNINTYIKTLTKHRQNDLKLLSYIRYESNFIILYPSHESLEGLQLTTKQFFKSIGLKLHPIKTKFICSQKAIAKPFLGLTFLDFDIIQKLKSIEQVINYKFSYQNFDVLICPSKIEVQNYKLRIREIIRKSRGTTQQKLIQRLDPLIQKWTLMKKTQIISKNLKNLDQYLFIHLWKWARKRHSKMSKSDLIHKYWHKVNGTTWVFGVKLSTNILFELQLHSKISLQRYTEVKNRSSQLNTNLIYRGTRTYKSTLMPLVKTQLIRKQKGRCMVCGSFFRPIDIIENENITPKFPKKIKNYKNNIQLVHHYCHLKKTKTKMLEIHRNIKLK